MFLHLDFGSCRVWVWQKRSGKNPAAVALEAGNSPRVVFSNYRELVRPADAVKWFAIAPGGEGKVIAAPDRAA